MATVTDYDKVESFTRNVYRNTLRHDAYEFEWMNKAAMAGHLMAMGAKKTTVLSAFLARILIETPIDVQLVAKFLEGLSADGDVILMNIIDMKQTEAYQYRPLDLIRKTRKDKRYDRYHLFLTDVLFNVKAYNRIDAPLERAKSKKINDYIRMLQRVTTDSLTKDLIRQLRVEMASVEYIQQVWEEREQRRAADAVAKAALLDKLDKADSLVERVKVRC